VEEKTPAGHAALHSAPELDHGTLGIVGHRGFRGKGLGNVERGSGKGEKRSASCVSEKLRSF
jgi:hypothetical protein